MRKKDSQSGRKKLVLAAAVLAAAGIGGTGVYHYRNQVAEAEEKLARVKEEKRQELKDAEGTYNNTSIVLSDTTKAQAEAIADEIGAEVRLTKEEDYAVLYLPEDVTIEDVYSSEEYGKYLPEMEPDYYVYACDTGEGQKTLYTSHPEYPVNDEYYDRQTYLDYVHMGDTWTETRGAGVKVAVIDTGIDTDNPEFQGRISEDSYNASTDKKVKDYGMDVVEDEDGHGTSVAGVLAASMDQTGITGVAPESDLIVIKCDTDGNGQFTRSSDLVFGLAYAIECDADVVNMSFGTDTDIFSRYTKLAVDSDVVCVASAGNEGSAMPTYPAADENVIGVGALEADDWELANYSNYGDNSDVLAPGTVYTTQKDGTYAVSSGTSMAAPVVSGAVALYLSGNPNTEYTAMKSLLEASSVDLGVLGEDWQHGFGVLDIHALVREEKGTITYEMLTDEMENETQVFVKGHTVQAMAEPERENLVLDGWFYDDQTTDECEYYTDIFTEDVTLYAGWINEDDGTAWQYTIQPDDTVEITAYTGKRRYLTVPRELEGKTVSGIGEGVFEGNTRIRQVTLPDSVTRLGARAFYGCSSLREMEVPGKVAEIGEETFYGCTRLSQVSLVQNGALKEIRKQAFAMSGITSISLPVNLTGLAADAFYADTNLRTVRVAAGNKVFQIKNDALYNTGGDTLLYYPAGKGGLYEVPDQTVTIGDYAFAYTKCREVVFPETLEVFGKSSFCNSYVTAAGIPKNVRTFGKDMFRGSRLESVAFAADLKAEKLSDDMFSSCWNLKEVKIPENISELGEEVFAYSSLKKVEFADGSRVSRIGYSAFTGCQIEEFHVPDAVTVIESSTFYFCPNLKVLEFGPDSKCQTIGDYAFAECRQLEKLELPAKMSEIRSRSFWNSGLKEIRIGKGIATIQAGAFSHCQQLDTITVDNENKVYTGKEGVLFNKEGTELLVYPAAKAGSYQVPDGVTRIREGAFAGASRLENIKFSDTLTEIEGYAFSECTSLNAPVFPTGLTTIGENAFEYCVSFEGEITVPKNVISVGRFSFYMDYDLKKIVIESDSRLSRIGYGAFGYCGIEDFTVPESISSMGQEVFTGCTNLIAVTFEGDSQLENLAAWTFSGAGELRQITFEEGSNLRTIEARALEGLNKLQRITLENCTELTKIGNYAFKNNVALSEIIFPESLTEIGRYAFNGCVSLTRLDMPEKLDRIGRYAFLKDQSLNIYFKASELPGNLEENWNYDILNYYLGISDVKRSGDWEYALGADGMANIIGYYGSDAEIILDKVDGYKVASIGSDVFKDNETLHAIQLPETLTGIYQRAFAGTAGLETLTVPAAMKIIDTEAFKGSGISTIVFGGGSQLETLGSYAFAQTSNLKTIAVPDSVSRIRDHVFYKSGVQEAAFGSDSSLTEIGRYAFSGSGIHSAVIPAGVKKVDYYAFADTEQLQSVDIKNVSDMQIMGNAFYGSGLDSILLPEGVTYLGEFCFTDCKNLTGISVADGNKNYASSDGALFNKEKTRLITCPAGKTGAYTVPDTVLSFMSGAFEGCNLNEIHMSESCKLQTLGYRTFYDCDSLEVIDIPDSILSIDNYAFGDCDNLQKVNISASSQLSGIYKGAFYKDEKLETLLIPDGVQEIGDYAFYGCAAMDTVQLGENSGLKRVSDHAFEYAGITGFTMPKKLDEVGAYAFNGAKLRTVGFNTVVTSIGDYAFADCGLVDTFKMVMPKSIEYLGSNALKSANNIKEITIPFVGKYENETICSFKELFGGNISNIKKVTVLKGEYLGSNAFLDTDIFNNSLETIVLPETLVEIGSQAFMYNCSIKKIDIPDNVQVIGDSAFAYMYLESIHLPKSLKTIGEGAFWASYKLKNIVLPDSLEKIGQNAFYQSEMLETITIPENVKYIGNAAFSGCRNLEAIVVAQNNQYFCSIDGILYDKNCTRIISAPGGYEGVLKIPEGITEIPEYAFSHCEKITEIEFASSVEYIGLEAFEYCIGLKTVVIPETIKNVGSAIFFGCEGLEKAEIYAKLTDLKGMFNWCDNLKSIKYPDTIEKIESFDNCELEKITIGDDVTSVGLFGNCKNLKFVYIGEKTELLRASGVFSNCPNLTTLVVSENNPYYKAVNNCLYTKDGKIILSAAGGISGTFKVEQGVETISDECFENCTKLEKIILPDSVVNIKSRAFSNCDKLEKIITGPNISKIETDIVDDTLYKRSSENWKDGVLYIDEYAVQAEDIWGECRLKEGTKLIADNAFKAYRKDNTHLTSVVLPDSVKFIGRYAFYNCSELKTIRMSNNIKRIEDNAFLGCDKLWSINISSNIEFLSDYIFQVEHIKYASIGKPFVTTMLLTSSKMYCLKIPSMAQDIAKYKGNGSIENYILTDFEKLTEESFEGVTNSRIFINVSENEDFPQGWNNGNKVYYKDQWHYAEFSSEGVLIQMSPTLSGEILQAPTTSMVENLLPEGAEFAGWDINGDGLVDKLPVTLTEDIYAEAVYNVDIKSISLDEQTTVEKGYTKKLEVKYSPAHYTVGGGVTFTSSDESIVTVDSEGILTGVKEGTAEVTAVLNNNPSVTASCTVEVVTPSYGIRFEPNYGQLNAGETLQLEPQLKLPEEEISAEPVITWKSEDETIATVENGLISAAAPGSVIITASCGEYTADYYLTVLAPLEEISVDPKEGSLNVGETQKLKVSYLPANTTDDKTVTWFSTRTSVATVDDEGLVTAVGPGTAKIKVAVGNKITTYEITVKAPLKWIKLNTTTGTMRLNRTKQMEVIYEPVNTTDDKTAVWTSTDPQVASVDESGRVTAVSRGKAVITAKVGDLTASYDVTVIGLRDENTGIIVSNSDETEMDEDMLLYVSEIRKNNWKLFEEILRKIIAAIGEERAKLYGFTAYDISLLQSGQTVQPGTTVDVDIPAGVREDAVVYRVENDGSLTDMHVSADEEGYYSFETEHFSTYVLGIRHNWSTVPLEEKEATCTEAGWISYKCLECDEINKIETPALGHQEREISEIAATCTEAGRSAGIECEICGEVLRGEEEITALGHVYGEWKEIKAATCIETGIEERTCKRDESHKETRNISALGHQEKNIPEIPATCTEPGKSAGVECEICGEVLSGETEISELGHTYGEWKEIKAATCTEAGTEERTCNRDESHKETRKIAALGHQEKEVAELPATCTEPGRSAGAECTVCGEILRGEEELPALGHDYGEWKELKAVTCTEAGTEERTCKRDAIHKETRKISALGHQEKKIAEIPATCTEPGRSAGAECKICGEVLRGEEELPALGHDYGEWSIIKAPTEKEEGEAERTCKRDASHKETKKLAALGHHHQEKEVTEIPATCTESGRTAGVECKTCGEILRGEEELPALGHDYGEWKELKAATCTEAGTEERTCKRDASHKETRKIAALGHQEKEVAEIPATCTEPGRSAGVECTVCGEILRGEEKLPALGHDYGEWKELKAATCTEAGTEERTCKRDASHKETRKIAALGHQEKEVAEIPATCTEPGRSAGAECTVCGEILRGEEELPALGHDYGEWKELKAATCTEAGTEERTCKRNASHKETGKISALGHQEKEIAEIPATCTEPGRSAGAECKICGEVLRGEEELPALGHDYGDWIIIKAPTEKEEGEAERTCKRDTSHKETKKLAALGHHHQEKEVPEIPATCTESGRTAGVECETCGEILRGEEKLPALGHDYGEWKELKAATCTEAGTEERTCKRDASHKESRKIAALGHQEKEVAEIPATCTEPGRSAGVECTVCGEILRGEEKLPALGHDYGEWKELKAAICTEAGTEERTCKRDASHKETRNIPALGHQEKAVAEIPATCTEPGRSAGTECSVCGEVLRGEEELPALGHDYGDWIIIKAPTEKEEGEAERTCKRDTSHKETKKLAALGHHHQEKEVPEIPATCTEPGRTAGVECETCGEILRGEEKLPALGHDYGDWKKLKAATCTEPGTEERTCKRDASHKETREISALGHQEKEVAEIPATCTEAGRSAGTECAICGEVLSGEAELPALGHDYSDWITIKEPTYTEEGTEEQVCSRDPSHRVTRSIPKLKRPLSECEIKLSDTAYVYDGGEIRPEVTISYNGTVLTEGTDYILSYENNIDPGTATVTIEAAENSSYIGTVQKNFVIRAVLDEYVTVVQPGAFKGCANLTNVNIRSTVTGIGEQAFADCKNLRNIYFYGNCPETGKDMFQNVTANAYYPYNDLTWSLDKLQDYGGNITWCPWNPQTGEPARRDLSICEMTVSAKDLTYNGKAQTPQITVTDSGKVLQEGVDYTVTYKDNVKAGTATVTATGAGTYGGSITTRFVISKASNTIKVSDITKTASSKSQTVKTTVRVYGGAKLTYSSNNKSVKVDKTGKLTIAKNFAGKAVITVKSSETSCYKAVSKKFNITVKPAAVTISKASNSAKQKITVSWKKNTTCSGYAVQYSTDKSFKKGVKTVYISKNSTVKATLSKLTKGKTYYVRIASYKKSGSTKIYSAWSKVKSVKVKK